MKKTILFLFFLLSITSYSQKIWKVNDAVVLFEASVPFFEPVAARNDAVEVTLNTKRGHISFDIKMKKFRFERSLMEEHFNEHYLETKRYPLATFKGMIDKFDLKVINKTPKTFNIKGVIVIHGKSKPISVTATLNKTTKGIELKSQFSLQTDDFNIEIPFLIREKISKTVNVSVKTLFRVLPIEASAIVNASTY
ncbi:YceI family protein [Flavobacterium faecale]|uniref:YceI family protein n=1 Tax=Flavobacterium faecale TaxID=1355330 RepID=UPI003AAA209F